MDNIKLRINIDTGQYMQLQERATKEGLSSTGYIKKLITDDLKKWTQKLKPIKK